MPAVNDWLKLLGVCAIVFPAAWIGVQAIAFIIGLLIAVAIIEAVWKLTATLWRMLR
jgi:hypothetical protein